MDPLPVEGDGLVRPDNRQRILPQNTSLLTDYAALLHDLTDAIVICAGDQLIFANHAAARLLGYSRNPALLLSRPLNDLFAPEDWPRLQRRLKGYAHPTRKRTRLIGIRRDGRRCPLLVRFQPLATFESPTMRLILSAAENQRQAVGFLREQNHMLVELLGNLPGMAYRCRYSNRREMEFVSGGCYQLTGYTADDIHGSGGFLFDKLVHPSDRDTVSSQLERALGRQEPFSAIYRLVTAGGEERWVKEQGRGVYSGTGKLLAIEGFITDITESHRMGLKLAHQATHDELTGLSNRRHFEQRLERALAYTKVHGFRHTLCYLDMDQFKIVNDTVGHRAGDELLRHVAMLLKRETRSGDTLARLGGDEFGLLLENCPVNRARPVADKLVTEISEFRFPWDDRLFEVGISVGLVEIGPESDSVAQLMSHADIACYAAKDAGRNRIHIFHDEDGALLQRHSELLQAAGLRDALENDRFRLYCQPIRRLDRLTGPPEHYEILLRLLDADGNIVMPGAFIPAAERFGLMIDIDKWVIRNVIASYETLFEHARGVNFAINLSGNSLNDESLRDYVYEQIDGSSIAPEQLCFEITETAAVRNLTQAIWFMNEVRQLGCRFALDDFGSGLSSFAYLKYFSTDYLKIDGSFVRDLLEDSNDRILVAAINQIGHAMGVETIAECAESNAVVRELRKMNVDYVQGSAVGKPIPFDRINVIGL